MCFRDDEWSERIELDLKFDVGSDAMNRPGQNCTQWSIPRMHKKTYSTGGMATNC